MPPRLLVVEGNTADGRAQQVAAGGAVMSEGYADLLRQLSPGVVVDICYPADAGANLPGGSGLAEYDGIAITGSSLNVYDRTPAVDRQVELARMALGTGTPIFGSCWGLQVLTVAAGGSVAKNPRGREIGFGRRIAVTAAGARHPMYARKPQVFDAVTVHLDEVETLPPGTTVLATSSHSAVQAAEIRANGTVAWGVQYHPEFTFGDIAAIMRRYGQSLVTEGFFADEQALRAHVEDLEVLGRAPDNKPLAWRLGIDGAVLEPQIRTAELANWICHEVLPTRGKRGRA